MKKRNLFLLLGFLPLLATAHPLPIEHSHDGILNGWEGIVVITVTIIVAVLLAKKVWKSSRS